MTILVSRLSSLGDVICSLPVVTALKNGYPDAHVSWLIDPKFAPVLECSPLIDQILPYEFNLRNRGKFERSFDLALDLQGLFKSAWPILWAHSPLKLGYHWQREGAGLVTRKVLPDPTSLHVVDQYVDVARAAGGVSDRAEFSLAPRPDGLESVRRKLGTGRAGSRFVVLNPSAGWASKRWPAERFGRLIDYLHADGTASVLIGGGQAADRQTAKEVVKFCNSSVIDLTGETNLYELIALVSLCAAHVGGDTGSSHLAAAFGRPAIGLYSITNPVRSCPYGFRELCHYDRRGLHHVNPGDVYETVSKAIGLSNGEASLVQKNRLAHDLPEV
jgi:heptosyltransferase-1